MEKRKLTEAKNEIADAAQKAVTTILAAAESERHTLALAAADALKVTVQKNGDGTNDHDILTAFRAETKIQMDSIFIKLTEIAKRDETYVCKEDFEFWRNIIVGVLSATMATTIGIIIKLTL